MRTRRFITGHGIKIRLPGGHVAVLGICSKEVYCCQMSGKRSIGRARQVWRPSPADARYKSGMLAKTRPRPFAPPRVGAPDRQGILLCAAILQS